MDFLSTREIILHFLSPLQQRPQEALGLISFNASLFHPVTSVCPATVKMASNGEGGASPFVFDRKEKACCVFFVFPFPGLMQTMKPGKLTDPSWGTR